jgi:NAD(P)H-nitrite reductase large subunit
VVNDFLETSAPDIYAAGDVAEWQGRLYGIIPAAREQGLIAAQNMVETEKAPRYAGTNPSSALKGRRGGSSVLGRDAALPAALFLEEKVSRKGAVT